MDSPISSNSLCSTLVKHCSRCLSKVPGVTMQFYCSLSQGCLGNHTSLSVGLPKADTNFLAYLQAGSLTHQLLINSILSKGLLPGCYFQGNLIAKCPSPKLGRLTGLWTMSTLVIKWTNVALWSREIRRNG